jgi:hypothetical protein
MPLQSNSAENINLPVKCKTCQAPTYLLGNNFEPECCACLEKRLSQITPAQPDIEVRQGRIYWTKV